ncbi:dihydrodipicolinate synthase family protein [Aestuariimicrobium ganziense]|uniref:dihydrodipicolinate synthase family protein n=1 Tax=Aestuariimicrobium ganziense TaxID=2773677 RepID=UPI00194244F3|nr:dihydrodipicolinate synthase family protein [Aestuariimicrobium ganziense]
MTSLNLPRPDGSLERVALGAPREWTIPAAPASSRVAFAAAHVVADPLGDNTPGAPAVVDWDSTLRFRHHLFRHGLGVAEAMDTAQRGMGMNWSATQELIRRSAVEAASAGARIAAGVGTDQLTAPATSVDEVRAAYEEQLGFVESTGAQAIVMASRQLAAVATGKDDYLTLYAHLLDQADRPVILHWLGPAFDPALEGYWGSSDVAVATQTVLELIRAHADKVDGIKVSLLDADHERGLRAELPEGVRLYTGDDFNYPELIKGDGRHHSDALLGIFAAIAPAAATALAALDSGDDRAYDDAFAATVPLSRHIFSTPTYHYKVGIAFLSWLSGHQDSFTMVGGLQSARSLPHLASTLELAAAAGLLPDVDLAADRFVRLLAVQGIEGR